MTISFDLIFFFSFSFGKGKNISRKSRWNFLVVDMAKRVGQVGSGQVLVGLVGFAGQLGHRSKWVSF